MPEPDAFDPTHALDGWRPPPPAPVPVLDLDALLHPGLTDSQPPLIQAQPAGFDPTHLLDGWRPPAPPPLDLELKSLLHVGAVPDEAKMARLKARGYEMLDVEDIELVEAPAPRVVIVEAWVQETPPAPPLAEADPAPASLLEEIEQPDEQPEATVDLPLPDEPAWPLFMEEAQVLDAGGLPPDEPEPLPAAEVMAPLEAVDLPEEEPVPAVLAETSVLEPQPAELVSLDEAATPLGAVVEDSGATLPVQPAVVEACESDGEVEASPRVEDAELQQETAPRQLADGDTWMALDSAPSLPEPPPAALEAVVAEDEDGAAPAPEAAAPSAAVEAVEPAVLEPPPSAEDAAPFEPPTEEDAAPVEAVPPGVAEAPALDVSTLPPEPPSFIDDIHLPPVAPPVEGEAPVLDFCAAPPPPAPDPLSVIASIELPQVPPPAVVEMPALDIAALVPHAPEPDPRLLVHWQAGAWTALTRQVAAASEELSQTQVGLRVDSHAPQWLCAIWPPHPEDGSLGRWPELAAVVAAETTTGALQQLLAELPGEAPLWSADLEADWDLVAELVLHQDTGLRPAQVRALREFAEAQRDARRLRFSEGYALQGHVARRCA